MLEVLKSFPPCPGCEGRTDCVINQCAKEKGIKSCSECDLFETTKGKCNAPLKAPKIPNMPPVSIFFQGLAQRYQNWNVNNLKEFKKGNIKDVEARIKELISDGKTSRNLIDISVNLFNMKK